jgi:uncharacterized membrane protein
MTNDLSTVKQILTSYDALAFLVSSVLILGYYLYLNRRIRKTPESNVHVLNTSIRERWVKRVMEGDNMEILAIQTLRNSVMASNFMASTAILLVIGTINLSDKIGTWSVQWQPELLTQHMAWLWQLKLALLLLDFAIAFYCFSMAIRFFNHVGYMINLREAPAVAQDNFKQTCSYLNRAGSYYALGNRAFFFSLPIMMWFLGAIFLLAATLLLIAGLSRLDKVPRT